MEKREDVLLVNNDKREMSTLRKALEEEGYRTETSYNGKECLDKIREFFPDIIVSEVDMPVMDGFDLCRKIREIQRLEQVPFMFISSSGKNGQERLKGLRLGADDFVTRPIMPDEVVLRVGVILKRLKILRKLTITDEVTGLKNRRYFDQRLDEEIEKLNRYNRPLAVFLLDIDYFKQVNDTYGHYVGDEVLRNVASALEDSLRRSDLIARYGGDEFALIMPEHSKEAIMGTAERIRKNIENTEMGSSDKGSINVTVSIGGIWIESESNNSPSEVIRIADKKLYLAKENGRNRIELEIKIVNGSSNKK